MPIRSWQASRRGFSPNAETAIGLFSPPAPVFSHDVAPGLCSVDGLLGGELFDVVEKDAVKIDVRQTYPLEEAAQAHRDLEGRKTSGASVLLPSGE